MGLLNSPTAVITGRHPLAIIPSRKPAFENQLSKTSFPKTSFSKTGFSKPSRFESHPSSSNVAAGYQRPQDRLAIRSCLKPRRICFRCFSKTRFSKHSFTENRLSPLDPFGETSLLENPQPSFWLRQERVSNIYYNIRKIACQAFFFQSHITYRKERISLDFSNIRNRHGH